MTTTRPSAPHGLSWQLARLTAPLTRALAGRRFFPLWAVVRHVGRKTGRSLTVPVAVKATPELFIVVLPWGSCTNWARNVLAAGGCVVRWKGADHRTDRPEVVGVGDARPYYSRFEWVVTQRVFRAESFLLLQRMAPSRGHDGGGSSLAGTVRGLRCFCAPRRPSAEVARAPNLHQLQRLSRQPPGSAMGRRPDPFPHSIATAVG